MASNDSRPSLIVTLRCRRLQWICGKCSHMLAKWHDPPGQTTWQVARWDIPELVESATTCRCCRFLLQVLEASPWIQCCMADTISIEPVMVGSQHSSALERAFQDHLESKTTYEKYYRPRLRVFQGIGYTYPEGNHTFIFPTAPTGASDCVPGQHSPYAFHGRLLGAQADFSLIRTWFEKCASCHHGQHNTIPRHIPIRLVDEHDTTSRGCLPDVLPPIPNFRLVDVIQGCIVHPEGQVKFAALSYVWGTAQRLTLSHANHGHLSSPGGLWNMADAIPRTFQDTFEVVAQLSMQYIWIDALCILQDDEEELRVHMDMMESVYGAAEITIVSDNESADIGMCGVSLLRTPQQATFEYGKDRFVSTRQTFAETLKSSAWEKRAWCLQEKLFSKRLLIFANSQVFYHCTVSTWFEDTIMEPKGNISGFVHMREKPKFSGKGNEPPQALVMPNYTAYESHRETFGRGFWSLIETYTSRDLSFDSDALRAFDGILKSVETHYGPAYWGLPRKDFARGLSWSVMYPTPDRRDDFPSWSWAGWRSHGTKAIAFVNYKRSDNDLQVSNGKYNVSQGKITPNSVFDLEFYYHEIPAGQTQPTIRAMWSKLDVENDKNDRSNTIIDPQAKLLSEASVTKRLKQFFSKWTTSIATWGIPGHPGERGHQILPKPAALSAPPEMPQVQHIIRFWTSVSKALIKPNFEVSDNLYNVLAPHSDISLGTVRLARAWNGGGKEHELIYISRWCHDWYDTENDRVGEVEKERLFRASDEDKKNIMKGKIPERLNVMLVEHPQGWGEVRRKVALLVAVSITDWRMMNPKWKLVSLA